MADIQIYTTQWCPYCVKAKALFTKLEQKYLEINIETEPKKRIEMEQRAPGISSVPQIFINGQENKEELSHQEEGQETHRHYLRSPLQFSTHHQGLALKDR